jgi:XTP/dITP diphosphohydrolase
MHLDTLVLASGNKGKLRELKHLLKPFKTDVKSQKDFSVPAVEETGLTFVENALLKARAASRATKLPALGDDSGLVVDALKGQPGIYSARFAGENATDQQNNELLLEKLSDVPPERRGAIFYCCLVLVRHHRDPAPIVVSGVWHGQILESPKGQGGFGYDPLFFDPVLKQTAAELSLDEKSQVSHRGQALRSLIVQLQERP